MSPASAPTPCWPKASSMRSASSAAPARSPAQVATITRLSRMLASDDSSPSSRACCSACSRLRTRAVEIVDVAKPLAELEDDARVDCRRWAALLERERPHRSLLVEAVAEEEVGTHARAQRRRDEAGIGVRNALEQRQRLPRGGRRLRKVDSAGVQGDGGVAAGLENGIAGVRERLLCERRRRGLAAAPVVDLDERQQRPRAQVTRLKRRAQLFEQRPRGREVACEMELLGKLELELQSRRSVRRKQP